MKKKIGLIFCILLLMSNVLAFAVDVTPVINASKNPEGSDKLIGINKNVIGIIQVVAMGVASIMLVSLAIKYMLSAPEEKADVKKHMIPFAIGAVFIFASVGIVEIIKTFTENIPWT